MVRFVLEGNTGTREHTYETLVLSTRDRGSFASSDYQMRTKTDPLRVDSVEGAPSLPTAADGSETGGAVGERLQQL